ncbi:unnamed protein product [Effrenium voratum]|nr:unnamed protein product [Effrenium voratum]
MAVTEMYQQLVFAWIELSGSATSLRSWALATAAVLFMILIGASHTQIRQLFVEQEEKKISFGGKKQWQDVEADECAFDKADMTKDVAYKEAVKAGKPILWEQWSGTMARGKPSTLIMSRLSPALTVRRAPGPGAIRKIDWAPLAKKHLQGRHVILHTDSAKSYKAKVDGVHHDSVVHCKKLITLKNGKKKWSSPQYVRVVTHRLRDGTQLKVKAGAAFVQPSMSTGCGAKISGSKLEIW